MGKSKSLDQLLKELNDMQLRFNNLNDELVIGKSEKRKKKIKTDLASDEIDTDFFKTLTVPKKNATKKKKDNPNLGKKEDSNENLLFSLDTKSENLSPLKIKDKKSIEKTKINDISIENKTIANIKKTIVTKDFNKTNFSIEKTDLDNNKSPDISKENITTEKTIIPETLNKVNTPTKSANINEIKNVNLNKTVTNIEKVIVSDINKTPENKTDLNINKTEETNKITEEKKKINKESSSEKTYLSIKQKLDRIKKEIAVKEQELKKSETKAVTTQKKDIPKKKPLKKSPLDQKEQINKQIKQKTAVKKNSQPVKKNDTVDILTIIILVLLIILIITAWILLK